MRIKGLLFTLFFVPLITKAQNTYTLDECVAYALENNVQLKIQALEGDIAKGTIGETKAQGLPQLNANAGFQDNITIQTSFIQDFVSPAAFEILFREGLIPRRDLGAPASFPAQFGTPVNGNAGFSVSQLIFNGSYFVGLRAAKSLKELTEKQYIQSEIDVVEVVSKAYYLVLVSQDNLELLTKNYDRINSLFKETEALYKSGFVENIDVLRLKVQLNNLKTTLKGSTEMLKVSLAALKLQMGMAVDTPISLSESLKNVTLDLTSVPLTSVNANDRIEFKILQDNRDLALLDIKNFKVQYLPNLNANFNLGWTSGVNSFGDLTNFNSDTWFRFTNWGLSLNIPIFDGFSKKYKIQKARARLSQTEFGISQLENSFKLEELSARTSFNNAIADYTIQKENVELAEEVFKVTRIKYQEGVGSNLEVIEADTDLKTAQTNYFNAIYNALVAKVDLLKALGILK